MHHCLIIVEVQRAIFLEIRWHQYKGIATLAKLARTCKTFNSVALDVLWVTLESFVFLVKSLPQDLWKIGHADRTMIFQRPMSPGDWEIFFKYSSRIRHLSQSVGPEFITKCSNLGDDVIFALSNPPTYGPLIPYLRTLHWDQPNRKYASLLRLLLTPSLVTLSLPLTCALKSPEVSILASIGVLCPSLKSFDVAPPKPFSNILDPNGGKLLSGALMCLHSLESLWSPALNESAVMHLSRLPFLAHLSLELQPGFQLDKVRPFMAPPAFSSIASLRVHAHVLPTLTSLLESARFQPTILSFVVASTPTIDALRLFFVALTGACGSGKLSRVSLTTTSNIRQPGAPQQVTLSTFRYLLALPTISEFTFDIPCEMSLDDDALISVTKHWPNLTALSLNATSGWGIPSRVTHRGLITLLARYPTLVDFALSVDFSEVDGPHEAVVTEVRPGGGIVNDRCLAANFVTSAIISPITIAALLSDLIPEVETVRSAWHPDVLWAGEDPDGTVDVFRERWEEVDNLLPAFSMVRKQCARWVKREV